MNASDPPAPPRVKPLRRACRLARSVLVFLVVAFHLFFFAFRNTFDLWDKPILAFVKAHDPAGGWVKALDRIDRFTYRYANLVGCEQRFVMFGPPLARGASFPAFRLEFADGSSALLLSGNEPDPARFFRLGGWQIRKYEDYLCWPDDDLATSPERPLWEAYARAAVRRWRALHPEDTRPLKRVVLVRRRIAFTTPDERPGDYDPPDESDIVTFDPQGRLLP